MSTTCDGTPSGRPGRWDRFVVWFGHRQVVLLTLLMAVTTLACFVQGYWMSQIVSTVFVLVMAGGLHTSHLHALRMCEACITEMPLNGAELAAARSRRLRLVHAMAQTRYLVLVLVPILGSGFVFRTGWGAFLCGVAQVPPFAYLFLSRDTHHRLQPWCPQCQWGRGGDGHPELSPDPVDGRPLPLPA